MRIRPLVGVVAGTILLASNAVTAGPSGKMLAYTCAGCHGTDGSSVGPSSPHIAGLNPEYFVETMKSYQEDGNNPTIMNRIAKGYTEEQLEGMAEFFAAQTLRLTPQAFDPAKAELGAKYHDKYCEKCHEDGGRDASDGGTLAGQWMPYLHFSMADFLSGSREMTKKMAKKTEKLHEEHGDEAIDALIHFYASQEAKGE